MPRGVYKRTTEHRKAMSEAHLGQVSWNKGKKGLQVAWNKGLTKETDLRVKAISIGVLATGQRGRIPWNKGLTKETDERVRINVESAGRTKKGKPSWNKGLTSESHPGVAVCAKNRRGKLHPSLTSDTIIEHHNDLCHGKLRPNDVTYMTHAEHSRFHAGLRRRDSNGQKFI